MMAMMAFNEDHDGTDTRNSGAMVGNCFECSGISWIALQLAQDVHE